MTARQVAKLRPEEARRGSPARKHAYGGGAPCELLEGSIPAGRATLATFCELARNVIRRDATFAQSSPVAHDRPEMTNAVMPLSREGRPGEASPVCLTAGTTRQRRSELSSETERL